MYNLVSSQIPFLCKSFPTRFQVWSAENFCKQFGCRSGPTKCRSWSASILFDTGNVIVQLAKSYSFTNGSVKKPFKCITWWTLKFPFSANFFPHDSQECNFSPVWSLWCLYKEELSPKHFPQNLHLNGFSPVCVLSCRRTFAGIVKHLLQ